MCKYALVNFSKTKKFHLPYGFVKYCSLLKIYSCLLTPNCTRNRVVTNTHICIFHLQTKFDGSTMHITVGGTALEFLTQKQC